MLSARSGMRSAKKALTASALLACLPFWACTGEGVHPRTVEPGEVACTNGRFYTQDLDTPWASALVTDGDRIVFVGTEQGASAFIDEGATQVDLAGLFVMPGFVDAHTHPGLVAAFQASDDSERDDTIPPGLSRQEHLEWLENYARRHPWTPFVVLRGWDVHAFLPDGPTKDELDEIFPYRPVLVLDNSGHSTWANSSALWVLGIDHEAKDLSPGLSYFVRDTAGEPTGWIKEWALLPKLGNLMVPSAEQLESGLSEFLAFLSSHGVTALYDGGNFGWHDQIYEVVAELDREGRLPLRYEGTYHVWHRAQTSTAVSEMKRLRSQYGSKRLRFNTVKVHYDGVPAVMTAAMLEPYVGAPDARGAVLLEPTALCNFMLELERADLDLHLHTVGDGAVRSALEAVELARKRGTGSIEVTLAHIGNVAPGDIPRLRQLRVTANFTPHWFGSDFFGEASRATLGEARSADRQVAGRFASAGVNVTLSSDVTDEGASYRANPLMGLEMSITRRDVAASDGVESMPPADARMSLEGALRAYSRNGAVQLGYGESLGSLEAGKKADFVVLSANPFDIAAAELHEIAALATVVGGRVESGTLPSARAPEAL